MQRLVYFYKTDCEPCKVKKPIALELAADSGKPIEFVDAEDPVNAELVRKCKVKAVPTLCLMEDDIRLVGFYGKLIEKDRLLRFIGVR